jgi:hypothetical protein
MDYANVTRKDTYTSVAEDRRKVNTDYHFGQAFKPDPVTGEFVNGDRIKISLQVHDTDDNPLLAPYEDDDIAFVHVNGTDELEIYVDLAKCTNRSAGGIEIYRDRYATCAASTAHSDFTILTGGGRADLGKDPDDDDYIGDYGEDPEDVDVAFSVSMFAPDLEPPVITCDPPAVEWSSTDVSRACTAVDDGSGLANADDASFELWTSEPADSETDNALTDTREVCDAVGNCATAGPLGGNKVDKKAPVISIVQPTATEYTHSETLVLDYTVTDGGSGVDTVSPTMDGSPMLDGHGLDSGQAIDLLTELPLGAHTFEIDADDNVGNASPTESVTFTIIVTPESIIEAVNKFKDSGDIKPQLVNALLSKLRNAAKKFEDGKCKPSGNKYGAFINQVQAQSGKGITPFAAEILIADAEYLIGDC